MEERPNKMREKEWDTQKGAVTHKWLCQGRKKSFPRPHQRPLVLHHTSFIYNQAISRNPDEPNICVVRRVYSANACLPALCSPWWGKVMAYFVKKPTACCGGIWVKAYIRPPFASNEIVKFGTIIFRGKKYWIVCCPWNYLFNTSFYFCFSAIQKPNVFSKWRKHKLFYFISPRHWIQANGANMDEHLRVHFFSICIFFNLTCFKATCKPLSRMNLISTIIVEQVKYNFGSRGYFSST